jgi:hypothetical protein
MAANTTPIFPLTPKTSWARVTATNNTSDLTSGVIYEVFSADALPTGSGARIDQIKIRPVGSSSATVVRLWVNNGSTTTVAANNSLIHEVSIASTTANPTTALTDYLVTLTVNTTDTVPPIPYLPAGYKVYATTGTGATVQVTVHGGEY